MKNISSEKTLGIAPSSPRFDSQSSRIFFKEKIISIAEVKQQGWLEESGLLLENVDQTHLVLASGKRVLQKRRRYFKEPIAAFFN